MTSWPAAEGDTIDVPVPGQPALAVPVLPADRRPRPPAAGAEPLQPLTRALAAGQAFFSGSRITAVDPASSRGFRKLTQKLGAIFQHFPGVTAGGQGVQHERGGLVFTDVTMGGSSHLVGCRGKGREPFSPGTPTDLVTGMCLFGGDSVLGRAGEFYCPMTVVPAVYKWPADRVIEEVIPDLRLHVYEVEALARLSSFIRTFTGLPGLGPVRIRAHIPGPEYDVYGMSLYARGLLSAELYAQYREAVRARARLIGQMLTWCLMGVGEVTVSSPLSLIDGIDVFGMAPAALPGELHDAARQQNRLWEVLLDGKPPSLGTLIQTSYIYHYLASAAPGGQLVFAEGPEEEPIYWHAVKASARAGVTLAGAPSFYIHPRAVVTRTVSGCEEHDQDSDCREHLLRNCKDGCEPGTIALALNAQSRRQPDSGGEEPVMQPAPEARNSAQGSPAASPVFRSQPVFSMCSPQR